MSDKNVKDKPIKIGNLRVVRINDINLVPRHLLDQVKGRQWETDKLIEFVNKAAMVRELNLYVLIDEKNVIKGVLLFEPNFIENNVGRLMSGINFK